MFYSNNRDSLSWSKIDKFLISSDWEDYSSNVVQSKLLGLFSDNFPILLDCDGFQRYISYFKFEKHVVEN